MKYKIKRLLSLLLSLMMLTAALDGKACQICALTQIESGRCYLFTPDCTPILVYAIQGRKLYCL